MPGLFTGDAFQLQYPELGDIMRRVVAFNRLESRDGVSRLTGVHLGFSQSQPCHANVSHAFFDRSYTVANLVDVAAASAERDIVRHVE